MWDPVSEKSATLPRAGDFYTKVLTDTDRKTCRAIVDTSYQTRMFRQLDNLEPSILSAGYFEDNYRVIRFTDRDVLYYGTREALQTQHVGDVGADGTSTDSRKETITIPAHTALKDDTDPTGGTDSPLYPAGLLAVHHKPLLVPSPDDTVTLPADFRIIYGLRVPKDLLITAIQKEDGEMLYANSDYEASFGVLHFYVNPIQLFPRMRFMAFAYTERRRNLYCYPLGVDVYGPVDRIDHYYKKAQSVTSLYKASAQAAGFPVIRRRCTILSVSPLHSGAAYYTTDGRYDADFPHTHLTPGTELEEGTVVAGDQLYQLIGPDDPLPVSIKEISLDYAIPVKGLFAPNAEIQLKDGEGNYYPQFTGDEEALARYHKFLEYWYPEGGAELLAEVPESANGLDFFLHTLCANRFIICRVNRQQMTTAMYLRLMAFLRQELPLGSVLTVADLPVTIDESNLADA